MKYPIVVLHGWGLSAGTFEPLISELRRHGFPVWAPDLPGFGNSKIPEKPLQLSDYAEFLSDYMQSEHIVDPILLAQSFGGRVALKYQAVNPTSIRALVLTGTPGYTPIARKKLLLFVTIAKIGKLFFLIPFTSLFRDKVRSWYYYVVGARDYYRAEGVMRDTFKGIVREELVTSMKKVHVPTLLVWGAHDIIVPVPIAKKMKETIAGAKLIVLPDSGHGVSYKNPKLFYNTIAPWLQSL
ncbi:MAG: alpha/beta hydrolase [Candidatus Gottesmanbacteria bacterium]|nr:alpha/beta hydrolase [Candidatus Gottesmanbacteria bacterium]